MRIIFNSFVALVLFFLLLIAILTITPEQEYFGWILFVPFLFLFFFRKKQTFLFFRITFLVLASILAVRYIFFRTVFTLQVEDPVGFWAGLTLYGAELYSLCVYLINLIVNVCPRVRKTPPLPETLPTVDIFIPTYDEDEDVAYTTAIACKHLDYPSHLVNIYILNDGSRLPRLNNPELQEKLLARHERLQELAQKAEVHYLTRTDGAKAKAGMINAAFTGNAISTVTRNSEGVFEGSGQVTTSGELVLILDCDHIPTKNFLKKCVGHFYRDKKLFLVQTPHFMINADPLRKNTSTTDSTPCESWLFYREVQRGLDKWGGSYFCGSAAILRRSMLLETGGICGDTITEDAETALEMHSRGYTSAFVTTPMVAGLAPESFDAMIRQRIRWCQGMLQILLLKNPLLHKGLSLAQRFCYMNNCLYWLFPVPRLVFMISPLIFLFFQINIYNASVEQVINFAGPYLISSFLTFIYLFGQYRLFLQSEIAETMQTFFLFPAVVSVFFNPRKPAFATTPKGLTHMQDAPSPRAPAFFILAGMMLLAFGQAIHLLATNPLSYEAVALTMFWNTYNFIVILCCLGIVWEKKQRRTKHRFICDEIVQLDGIPTQLSNLSASGFAIKSSQAPLAVGQIVQYKAPNFSCKAEIVRVQKSTIAGKFLDPELKPLTYYIYESSDRWEKVINDVLTGHGGYCGASFVLVTHAFSSAFLCIKAYLKFLRQRLLAMFVLAVMLLIPAIAFAAEISIPINTLVHADTYVLSGDKNELRIPFYLPQRATVNRMSVNFVYTTNSSSRRLPVAINLSLDAEPATEADTSFATGKSFILPNEKLIAGHRMLLATFLMAERHMTEEQKKSSFAALDLTRSTFDLTYEPRSVGKKARDLDFIFESEIVIPKQLAVILEHNDLNHIRRAIRAVQNIAIRLQERPLLITLAETPPSNMDCLFIGDSYIYNPPALLEGAHFTKLTEADLLQELPSRKTILQGGGTMTFKELGFGTVTFREYSATRIEEFVIPSNIWLTPNKKLRLSLDIAYRSGFLPESHLDVYINDEMFAYIRLTNSAGEHAKNYKIDVPTSLLNKGTNKIYLYPYLKANPLQYTMADDLYMTLFSSSSLKLPVTGIYTQLPDLQSVFIDGYPFITNAQLWLQDTSPEIIGATLNFMAILAQKRGSINYGGELFQGDWRHSGTIPKTHLIEIKTDPAVPKDLLDIKAQRIPQTQTLTSLTFSAHTGKEILIGLQNLWQKSLQEKISGTQTIINFSKGTIQSWPGETIIISDIAPLSPDLSYYFTNYPMTVSFILLFAILLICSFFWGWLRPREES